MIVVGHKMPLGRSTADQVLRNEIFDIINPYFLSPEDLQIVNVADVQQKTLWLETITNTQKGSSMNFVPIIMQRSEDLDKEHDASDKDVAGNMRRTQRIKVV